MMKIIESDEVEEEGSFGWQGIFDNVIIEESDNNDDEGNSLPKCSNKTIIPKSRRKKDF